MIPQANDNREPFETVASQVRNAKALIRIDLLPYQRAAGAEYEMISEAYHPGFDESTVPPFLRKYLRTAAFLISRSDKKGYAEIHDFPEASSVRRYASTVIRTKDFCAFKNQGHHGYKHNDT